MNKIMHSLSLPLGLLLAGCMAWGPEDRTETPTFRVKLFGCELPVPTTYAVNGREFDRIVLSRDSGDVGRIVVTRFSGYSEMYEVTDEKTVGHLIVAELVNHRQWKTPDYDMSIIRDKNYIVTGM